MYISIHNKLIGHCGPSQLTLGVPIGFSDFTGSYIGAKGPRFRVSIISFSTWETSLSWLKGLAGVTEWSKVYTCMYAARPVYIAYVRCAARPVLQGLYIYPMSGVLQGLYIYPVSGVLQGLYIYPMSGVPLSYCQYTS